MKKVEVGQIWTRDGSPEFEVYQVAHGFAHMQSDTLYVSMLLDLETLEPKLPHWRFVR